MVDGGYRGTRLRRTRPIVLLRRVGVTRNLQHCQETSIDLAVGRIGNPSYGHIAR